MKISLQEFNKKLIELRNIKFDRSIYHFSEKEKGLNCAGFVSYFFKEFDNLISYDKIINNNYFELVKIDKKDFAICLISLNKDTEDYNHSGIFLNNRIIHITNKGILAQDINVLERMFYKIDYYAIKNKLNGEILYV